MPASRVGPRLKHALEPMPELSVILPARNAENTIGRALTSTLRALPADSELFVLDDGSTDGTADVVAGIRDRRLRLESAPSGLGVSRGLNHLLGATDSDLVARMDADDLCLPWRFREQRRALRRHGTDVCFSTVVEWRPPSPRPFVKAPVPLSRQSFPLHLLLGNPVAHPAMMARRSALEAVAGYREVPAEDFDLWLRLATAGHSIERLGTPGLLYRLHSNQVTASSAWRSRSWGDSTVNEAYEQLSLRLLGQRLRRIVHVLADDTATIDDFELLLQHLEDGLTSAAASLRPSQRRVLLARLSGRLALARRQWSRRGAHDPRAQ